MFHLAKGLQAKTDDSLGLILKIAARSDVISFAGGTPDSRHFPVEALAACFEEVLAENPTALLQYSTPTGFRPLREWMAGWMRSYTGFDWGDGESIMITSGSQQGIDLVSKLFLDWGDSILTESPSYLGAINTFKSYGANLWGLPMDEEGIVLDDLEHMIQLHRPKFLYTVPNGQNPTGITMSLARRKQLVQICERYDLLIVEDDPYYHIRYEEQALPTLYELAESRNVIYLGSFSKILAPGLRVGWMVFPEALREPLNLVKQNADLMTNLLVQRALYTYLQRHDLMKHIQSVVGSYLTKRDLMYETLERFGAGNLVTQRPQAGIFLWSRLPKDVKMQEVLDACLSRNIAIVSGADFFPQPSEYSFMRLNFSSPSEENIREGIRILCETISDRRAGHIVRT